MTPISPNGANHGGLEPPNIDIILGMQQMRTLNVHNDVGYELSASRKKTTLVENATFLMSHPIAVSKTKELRLFPENGPSWTPHISTRNFPPHRDQPNFVWDLHNSVYLGSCKFVSLMFDLSPYSQRSQQSKAMYKEQGLAGIIKSSII